MAILIPGLTIGYVEDLNRGDVDDLKNFFLRWYGPNNATVTIGGDVKTADVVKLVEKYFGGIPRGPEVKPVVVPAAVLAADRYVSYIDNYAKLPLLLVAFPTVPNYHKDMGALACLAQVLGQGKNSVLYQQLVKKQLALQANTFSQLSELAGEMSFQLIPSPGKSLAIDGYPFPCMHWIHLKQEVLQMMILQNSKVVLKHNKSMACKVCQVKFHNWRPSKHFPAILIKLLT